MSKAMASGLVGIVLMSVLAGQAPARVPAPPQFGILQTEIDALEHVAGSNGAGRYSATYNLATRTLVWRVDYKLTTGPATAVRVRARVGSRIVSRTLCGHCVSKKRVGEKGPYLSVGGKIRNPNRDVVLLATPQFSSTESQVVVATKDFPLGELFGETPAGPTSGSGGRCC